MWSSYTKTFVFRDCFDECKVDGDIEAINKLIRNKECTITTDVLSVGTMANGFGAYKSEDDGSWNLKFYKNNEEIVNVSIWDYKEVHLCFEIEEKVETGEITIHYCLVKAFKEYQM